MTDRDNAPAPAPRWRSPALILAGLAVIAVIVVTAIVLLRDDEDDASTAGPTTAESTAAPDTTVAATEPSTTQAPGTTDLGPAGVVLSVDREAGCITVTTAAGSATGCPTQGTDVEQLDQRTFVADLDGPILITSESSDPFTDPVATVDDGAFAARCRWDDLAPRIPDGGLIEVAVCNDTGVMGVPTGSDTGDEGSLSYFTLPTPFIPEGADLGPGAPVDGLPGALAFTAPVQDVATCTILLRPDRSGWSESCGLADGGPGTALVLAERTQPALHEVTIDATGLITSAQRLGAMAPSSGCSIESANDLTRAVPASSLVTGIGCVGDAASLTTGSVLTQQGPPDGSIWVAAREDGVWAITDNGTGIDDALAFPVIAMATWSTWPATTVPDLQTDWSEPALAIPTQPTVESFTDELLTTLGTLASDPEFPPNPRLVAVQPDGLPLIVAQVDIGGDDSVAGAVLYIWLAEEFDDTGPTGWRAGEVLVGFVCARGVTPEGDLCI